MKYIIAAAIASVFVIHSPSHAETKVPMKKICYQVVSRGGTTYFPDKKCQDAATLINTISTQEVFMESTCRRIVGDECKQYKDYGVYPYMILETTASVAN